MIAKIENDGLPVDAAEQSSFGLPDVDDEPFLAVVLSASVDFLVTGNIADYPQDKCRGCKVVTPAEFMEHWRKLHSNDQ